MVVTLKVVRIIGDVGVGVLYAVLWHVRIAGS